VSEQVRSPFTDDQVASLNACQAARVFHPFTCGTDTCRGVLRAARGGWHCPNCDYRQEWALSWMADWSWRRYQHREPGAETNNGPASP
jgi:hypothetical protein